MGHSRSLAPPSQSQWTVPPAARATTDDSGNFTVTLTAHAAALSTTVVVSDGTTTLTLRNVAFGDLLFCSGQSNMQMPLDYSFGSAAEIAYSANYSNIRLYSMAGNQYASSPQYESRMSYAIGWVLPGPKTLQYAPNDVYNYFSRACAGTRARTSTSVSTRARAERTSYPSASYRGRQQTDSTAPLQHQATEPGSRCWSLTHPTCALLCVVS